MKDSLSYRTGKANEVWTFNSATAPKRDRETVNAAADAVVHGQKLDRTVVK
jgi:hypothetical protein